MVDGRFLYDNKLREFKINVANNIFATFILNYIFHKLSYSTQSKQNKNEPKLTVIKYVGSVLLIKRRK